MADQQFLKESKIVLCAGCGARLLVPKRSPRKYCAECLKYRARIWARRHYEKNKILDLQRLGSPKYANLTITEDSHIKAWKELKRDIKRKRQAKCPECGNPSLINDLEKGETICDKCGLVI
jgi:ribosomal protein S27E